MMKIPMNGATAAEPVDEKVSAQDLRGAERPEPHPRSASGINAMMMSALKITADITADAGEWRCMMFSGAIPGNTPATSPG